MTVRPASTVLVLRDFAGALQVFLVRRHQETAFMGGAHVFPGGRVDAADRDAADPRWCDGLDTATLADLDRAGAAAHYVAAIRELFEEAGILVARDASGEFVSLSSSDAHERFKRYRHEVHAGTRTLRAVADEERLRLALDALVPWAHWVTPPVDVRQFDTRFFVTRVPPRQTPAHDETETTASEWLAPSDALARCRRGEIVLPPPTWTTLRELEPFDTVDAAIAWARSHPIVRRQPEFVETGAQQMLILPDDPANPGLETRFVKAGGRWRAEERRA